MGNALITLLISRLNLGNVKSYLEYGLFLNEKHIYLTVLLNSTYPKQLLHHAKSIVPPKP